MPGHAHGAGGAAFVGAWTLMMIPMMLPSLAPVLVRATRPVVVALAYYAVWAAVGVAVHVGGRVVGPVVPPAPWVSWAQGALADSVGVHMSFWVGVACFAYLAFYALRA